MEEILIDFEKYSCDNITYFRSVKKGILISRININYTFYFNFLSDKYTLIIIYTVIIRRKRGHFHFEYNGVKSRDNFGSKQLIMNKKRKNITANIPIIYDCNDSIGKFNIENIRNINNLNENTYLCDSNSVNSTALDILLNESDDNIRSIIERIIRNSINRNVYFYCNKNHKVIIKDVSESFLLYDVDP